MSEQEHEFGYHALNSRVVAVYHPGLQQLQPRFVAVHLNRAFEALRDVDHYDAAVDKFANALDKPRFLRCIARTKGFHHHRTQPAHAEHGVYHLLANAGEECENHHIIVEQIVRTEGRVGTRTTNKVRFVLDVNAGMSQRRQVERTEGIEAL